MIHLVEQRINRGLSLRDAAAAIGVSANILQRAENGGPRPHPRHAKRVADFYGVQVTDIWPVPTKAAV